jgi:hypothetical protein
VNAAKPDLTSIVTKMMENLNSLRFGSTSVMLKVHDGRVVDISYTVTEKTKELTAHSKRGSNFSKGDNYER